MVKTLPAMQKPQDMRVRSLGWEDPLEESMEPTPVFLPGKSHGLWSCKESDMTERLSLSHIELNAMLC